MNLNDLAGKLFANVPEVAEILGADERTVRRAIAAGEIPSTKVGTRRMIPTAWLRQQAGEPGTAPSAPVMVETEQIAEAVAGRIVVQLARVFAALASDSAETSGQHGAEVA